MQAVLIRTFFRHTGHALHGILHFSKSADDFFYQSPRPGKDTAALFRVFLTGATATTALFTKLYHLQNQI
jgi:hypothetical protein